MNAVEGLVVKDVSIYFMGVKALDAVSLQVKPGEIVGLIGPNGAGKTSLLNCICRYYNPKSGEIKFHGTDLLKKKSHHLLDHGVARTFQELDLQPSLSVIDNLMIGQHFRIKTNIFRAIFDFNYLKSEERKHRRKARDLLRFFGQIRESAEKSQSELGFPDISGKGGFPDLLDLQEAPIGMLPYGAKKKTDLARALAANPKLLLLDEPAAGLSKPDLQELVRLIRAYQEKFNTSILLVEHNMPFVMGLCNRIVVLNFGRKIAEGTPEEIKDNPAVIEAYLGRSEKSKIDKQAEEKKVDLENPILETRKLDLYYGPVQALSGVSVKIPRQCITAILGTNGAGKSSLLRAISGIERLSNGEIFCEGERLIHWLEEAKADKIVRRGIIHVAEGRRILKELSIMENLKLAGYTCKSRHKLANNIEKVFHYFPILKEKLRLHDAGNLSGGQQQMLAIGQALIMEPKILLLDEPSLGLSPNFVEEVFSIIQKISENEKCSVVLVEQNSEMALKIASYAYVLDAGFVVSHNTSAKLANSAALKDFYLGA